MPKFEVYPDSSSQYRWRLKADNGEIMADSGESYESRSGCKEAVGRVKLHAPSALVEDK
jgi:uncharacterized protein YegP (UPF0339 family)